MPCTMKRTYPLLSYLTLALLGLVSARSEFLPARVANYPLAARGRAVLQAHCGPLSADLVKKVARDNTVLVTIVDKLVWHSFGPSYVENIQSAGITYWLIAALDPETSTAMGAQGITDHCFNAPQERVKYKGKGEDYGSSSCGVGSWGAGREFPGVEGFPPYRLTALYRYLHWWGKDTCVRCRA